MQKYLISLILISTILQSFVDSKSLESSNKNLEAVDLSIDLKNLSRPLVIEEKHETTTTANNVINIDLEIKIKPNSRKNPPKSILGTGQTFSNIPRNSATSK